MSRQPTKLVPERITVAFDFMDVLEWGDSIVQFNVSISVDTGEDSLPNVLLFGRPSLIDTVVSQQLQLGVPGVIYKVTATVATGNGDIWVKDKLLGIIQNTTPIPPPFGTYITSTPYPYYLSDSISVFSDIVFGRYVESIVSEYYVSSDIVFGSLREVQQEYTTDPEGIYVLSDIVSGTLVAPLIAYTWPFEFITVSSVPVSGSLVNLLIVYSNWPPESINVSSNIVSGSLV